MGASTASMEPVRQKLVAHLKDGEVLKGYSRDFVDGAGDFHLMTPDRPVATSRRIEVDELKAVFFVRSWGRPAGHVLRRYRFGVGGMARDPGRRVVVHFRDGERIWGYVLEEAGPEGGFYLVPADPEDNNRKIFVVSSSLQELQQLEAGGPDQ
jgi:uncharacterized protein DUF6982